MNSNIDVLKELEVKNREIYLNKLNIDLDANLENMLITIDNMISLFMTEVTNKVLEISSTKDVSKEVLTFHDNLHGEIKSLINKRIITLKDKVKDIDHIDYKDVINNETIDIIEKIKKYYENNIKSLIDNITFDDNSFDNERLEDYLKILNYEKFINKFKEAITNLDIILYNNYLESYKKFLDLNKKTLE